MPKYIDICYLARFLKILNGMKGRDEDTNTNKSDYKYICKLFGWCSNRYPFCEPLSSSDMASN